MRLRGAVPQDCHGAAALRMQLEQRVSRASRPFKLEHRQLVRSRSVLDTDRLRLACQGKGVQEPIGGRLGRGGLGADDIWSALRAIEEIEVPHRCESLESTGVDELALAEVFASEGLDSAPLNLALEAELTPDR